MGFFDDILAADAAVMLDPDLMPGVESVTYYPRDGGTPRTVNAMIDRGPGSPLPGGAAGSVMAVKITVRNDSTYGIATSEIDSGDRVSLDLMRNGTQIRMSIVKPGQDERWAVDAGMVGIQLR